MPPAPQLVPDTAEESEHRTSFRLTMESQQSSTSGSTPPKSVDSTSVTVNSEDGSFATMTSNLKASEIRKQKIVERKPFSDRVMSNTATNQALDFDSMPLIGRDKEVAILNKCFARIAERPEDAKPQEQSHAFDSRKELVFIEGISGSGKSAVALTLEKEVQKYESGIFVHGKFDMNTASEPYSGICKAFSSLCLRMKDAPAEALCAVQACINEQLGSEVDLLMHLIPELKDLIGSALQDPEVTDIGADEMESKLERLRFAFRVLMRAFSSAFSPVVLFVDDLQWADISSLQVLEFLISDAQNENALMVIGCYRSDEVDENSLLHNKMVALEEMTTKCKFQLTKISIEHFGLNEVQEVISSVLPNPNMVGSLGLATICLKRTLGNPFFVCEFLKTLHFEGLLHYDDTSKLWSWDVDKIDSATMSTANVVVMLHNRLLTLPAQVQSLLQCAAYLGSTFSEPTIDLVWTSYGRRLVETRIEKTSSLLEVIVKEEIVEKSDHNQYRWVHDKLQEAALSLTGKRRESFQLDIGRMLYYGLEKKQVEDELFTVVDLINNGNVLKLVEFASANLRAAEKARDLSAFQSAAEYAAHGIDLLKEDKWSSDRSLTLQLYTMAAEMEAMLGNVAAAERYSNEVLSQPDLSIVETLPLKLAKASTIGSTNLKFEESVKYYLRLLGDIGCRVTWARRLVPVQSIVKLMRIMKRVKATPQSFYDKMVPMEDPRQKAIASVFSKLVYYAYMAGDILLFVLATCKLVEMTLDYGVNEFSAKSFTSLGSAIIIAMEDFESATTFNNIALSMLKKFRGMHHSETTFLIFGPGLSWVKPFRELVAPMGEAVTEGLRSGDTEYAIWNLVSSRLTIPYFMGKPLSTILKECPKTLVQCEDAAQSFNEMAVKVLWQMMTNLHDSSCSTPSELEGEIFSSEKDEETNNSHLAFVHFAEGELALFNGDYEVAAKRALRVGDIFSKLLPAFLINIVEPWQRAVPLYAAARLTKKRKYRVEAKRLLNKIGKWSKAGNVNVEYIYLYLQAEQAALDKKYDVAEKKYEEAIQAALSVGHLHYLGLLNERYADYLEERSFEEKSKDHLRQAIQFYKEWGAGPKVEALERKV